MKPWWQKLFDASYLTIHDQSQDGTEEEVEFLEDVLELAPDKRVLDMCCGFGRHAIALAHRDLRVTGVDFSGVLLREGRRHARAAGVDVEWVESDARAFKTRRRYHAAINMFTAFGYFESEDDDETVLRRMADALRPGGLLCLDTMNHDWLVRHFSPQVVTSFEGGHAIDFNRFDAVRSRVETDRVLCFDGKSKKQHFSIRLYTGRELIRKAQRCGLEIVQLYGGFDKQPLTMETQRLILIARRPV